MRNRLREASLLLLYGCSPYREALIHSAFPYIYKSSLYQVSLNSLSLINLHGSEQLLIEKERRQKEEESQSCRSWKNESEKTESSVRETC